MNLLRSFLLLGLSVTFAWPSFCQAQLTAEKWKQWQEDAARLGDIDDTGIGGMINSQRNPVSQGDQERIRQQLEQYRAKTGQDGVAYISVVAVPGVLGMHVFTGEPVVDAVASSRSGAAEQIASSLESPSMGAPGLETSYRVSYTARIGPNGTLSISQDHFGGVTDSLVDAALERRAAEKKVQSLVALRTRVSNSVSKAEATAQACLDLSKQELEAYSISEALAGVGKNLESLAAAAFSLNKQTAAEVAYTTEARRPHSQGGNTSTGNGEGHAFGTTQGGQTSDPKSGSSGEKTGGNTGESQGGKQGNQNGGQKGEMTLGPRG